MYKDYPAAYQVSKGAALQVDTAFYDRVRQTPSARTLIEQFEVPIRTGLSVAGSSRSNKGGVLAPIVILPVSSSAPD